jgi:class 3 adenylate cyclase/predicted ATPase
MECGARAETRCASCGSVNPPNSKYCGECGAKISAAAPWASREFAPSPAAERRQLTVMFCDLVGSTQLASRLDPEDLREVFGAYHGCTAETVARFDGFVAKYMGDGVLVYFGYPQAHENDAERAVRAGLALVESVRLLQTPERLRMRIGIATGLVVVGDLLGTGAAQEQAVVGETPNLAARLQALAEPDTVVIAESTHRLVGHLFELADLGFHAVKGIGQPVRAFRISRAGETETSFDARQRSAPMPMIGRERELALLLGRWRQAAAGEGQVVLLTGEAGIGKSRIARALRDTLAEEPHLRISWQCSPYHTDSALYPVIQQIAAAAGFAGSDAADRKLDKLEAFLARSVPHPRDLAPLFANLLSLPSGRYPALDLSPDQLRARTLEALLHQTLGLSRQMPVLFIVEDLHWIDPTSLKLLQLVIGAIEPAQVLLVITTRHSDILRSEAQRNKTELTLDRLSPEHTGTIIERLAGGRGLPREVTSQILANTDGMPLFVEELTRTLLESDLLQREGDHYALTRPLLPVLVPPTLHDSLMARLDRLPAAAKETAQIGAVIGREFSYEILAGVSSLGRDRLQAVLDQLVASELVSARGIASDSVYTFKHILVQEVAYQSLLRDRRRSLHANIARMLESRDPEIGTTEPELLAHHYTEAGLIAPAIAHWQRAGERGARRSSNLEAINHLRGALDLLGRLPEVAERAGRELTILITLGPCLMATKGWGSPDVEAAYERARQLARELDRSAELFPALWGLWLVAHAGGHAAAARALQGELLALAQRQGNATLVLQAHHAGWSTYCSDGEFRTAQRHVEQGVSLYRPEMHGQQALTYGGHDPCVCALSMAALSQFILGFPEQARQHSDEAVRLAREIGHAPTLAHGLWYRAELCQIQGAASEAAELASIVLELALERGMAQYAAWSMMVQGWAECTRGNPRQGLARVEDGLAALRANGMKYHLPHRSALLAQAQAAAGKVEAALTTIEETLKSVEETGERWFESEAYRLRAVLLLARSEADQAEACLQHAIGVAARQQARLWQLRAASTLARHWHERGHSSKARDLLQPIYDGFTEGFDTRDLLEAKTLLVELQSGEEGSPTQGTVCSK